MAKHWTEAEPFEAHLQLVPYLEALKQEYRDARLIWFETFVGMYSDMQDVSLLPSRSSAPMSRHAASTSKASAMSSISTCR